MNFKLNDSATCGYLNVWECPKNGLYESFDFKHYFEEQDRHPFLTKNNEELAGFIFVNRIYFRC